MDIAVTPQAPTNQELTHFYLQAGFIHEETPPKTARATESSSEWYTVRAHDDTLLGIGRLITDYVRYGFIVDVIVEEQYQGRGIGKAIMLAIIDKCRALQLESVNLWPTSGKIDFYRKLGFIPLSNDQPLMKLKQ